MGIHTYSRPRDGESWSYLLDEIDFCDTALPEVRSCENEITT